MLVENCAEGLEPECAENISFNQRMMPVEIQQWLIHRSTRCLRYGPVTGVEPSSISQTRPVMEMRRTRNSTFKSRRSNTAGLSKATGTPRLRGLWYAVCEGLRREGNTSRTSWGTPLSQLWGSEPARNSVRRDRGPTHRRRTRKRLPRCMFMYSTTRPTSPMIHSRTHRPNTVIVTATSPEITGNALHQRYWEHSDTARLRR